MAAPPVKRSRSRVLDDSGLSDMSHSQMSAAAATPTRPSQAPPNAGQILGIELKDFMNHASLDLTLEPNKVNFITGRNGAGKSSVIQAVVLALGGDARMTKRGASEAGQRGKINVGSFVRHGCTKAEVRVRLSNVVDDAGLAFRPDVYGAAIVMERTIHVAPGSGQVNSRHVVKSAGGRIVYEQSKALEEKKQICQHFVIQLDNPTTILQQEEAKVFFTSNSDVKRYEFFFKATTLHAAKADYKKAREDSTVAQDLLKDKEEGRMKKEEQEKKMEKQFELIRNLDAHGNTEMMTAKELIVRARNAEEEAKKKEVLMTKSVEKLKQAEEKRQEKGFEMKKIEREFEEGQLAQRRMLEHLADLRAEVERAEEENRVATEKLKEAEQRFQGGNIDVARLREQIRGLNNEIMAHKKRSGQSARETDAKRVALQKRLTSLNAEKDEWDGKIREAGGKRKELEQQKKELVMTRSTVVRDHSKKLNDKAALEKNLMQLQQQQEHSRDSYHVFGVEFKGLMEDIKRNEHRFSRPPLGPVGKYVRLVGKAAQDRDLCDLIESDVGRSILRSFVVNSMEDQRQLQGIFKRHFKSFSKPPNITKLQFQGRINLHDGLRAHSTEEYAVVLDYLQFDDDMAFNFLISQTDIHTTLVLTDDQAEHLFSDPSRVPRNAKKAITPEFYRYFPAGQSRSYGSYYFERNGGRNLLAAAADTDQREIQQVTIQIADLQTEIERKKLEIDDYSDQIAQLGHKEQSARAEVEAQRSGLQGVNVEIQRCMASLGDLGQEDKSAELKQHVAEKEQAMDKRKAEVEQLKEKVKDLRAAVQSTMQELDARKGELAAKTPSNDSQQKLDMMEKDLMNKKRQFKCQENVKDTHKREIEKNKREREELLRKAEKFRREASEKSNGGDIGEVTETLKELELKKKKIQEQRQELSTGLSREEFMNKFIKIKDENTKLKRDFEACDNHVDRMTKGLKNRAETYTWTRDSQARIIRKMFNKRMAEYRLFGKLHFNHDAEQLSFEIAHMDEHMQKVGDSMPLSNFSGGERSRTLACFILSLWEMNVSPFRALDELDVYLDEVNRSQVEEQLIAFARANKEYQFIFISPQPPTDGREINVCEIEKQ